MIEITAGELSLDTCLKAVEGSEYGGICTFLGTVRDNSEGKSTDHLEYEAYREMASEVIAVILSEATANWDIGQVAVQHRTGRLEIGEISVIVAVSAAHRTEAFKACRYVIDQLKTRAPIWKKEFGEAGEMWVGGPAQSSEESA
jgi:molybdopterin synthase catalytic subunit